jgi:beta-glucanase (GH16 family)
VVEIDIIEQQGRYVGDAASHVDLNVHFTKDGHSRPTVNIDASKEFHVWAIEWQERRIDWYLDGMVISTYKGPTPQEKMFILMALFQYSGWIGDVDPNMTYPRDFEVDCVRVYARDTE